MVIDGKAAGPLIEQLKAALEGETAAVSALHGALNAGEVDNETLSELTTRMTDAHNEKMRLWDLLQKIMLDK